MLGIYQLRISKGNKMDNDMKTNNDSLIEGQ